MSDQPKPTTGEWTAERVRELLWHHGDGTAPVSGDLKGIADAHNAALAAERKAALDAFHRCIAAEAQLAAEREKYFSLHADYRYCKEQLSAVEKVRDEWVGEYKKLRDILDPDQHKTLLGLHRIIDGHTVQIQKLEAQLAAEREKYRVALMHLRHAKDKENAAPAHSPPLPTPKGVFATTQTDEPEVQPTPTGEWTEGK